MEEDKIEKSVKAESENNEVVFPEIEDPELHEAIKDLDPGKRRIIEMSIIRAHRFIGPIPHPSTLLEYDNVAPGLAERIVVMAEKEQSHRFECDKALINEPIKATKRGQWMGFVIAALCICASFVLALLGFEVVAGIIGGATVVGLVTVFVTNKPSKKENDKEV